MAVLRISSILHREYQKLGSYERLSQEIAKTNRSGRKIDRRKLKRITEGKGFSLGSDDLEILDSFLRTLGEGLADKPILVRQNILDALASKKKVVFVLGSRFQSSKFDTSIWDVRALTHIIDGLHAIDSGVTTEIHVANHDNTDGELEGLIEEQDIAVCSIGAPKASRMTSHLLDKMFPKNTNTPHDVPFQFCWPNRSLTGRSRFELAPGQIKDRELATKIVSGNACAIRFHGDEFQVDFTADSTRNYSVICAQNRASQFWLVVAGVSGPATEAASKSLSKNAKTQIEISPNADVLEKDRDSPRYGLMVIDSVKRCKMNHDSNLDTRSIPGDSHISFMDCVNAWPVSSNELPNAA